MNKYNVKGRVSGGKVVEDVVMARNKGEAESIARSRGLYIIEIRKEKTEIFEFKSVPVKVKIDFFNQLYFMVRGGVNIRKGLVSIHDQVAHSYFKMIVSDLIDTVENGGSLSSGLEKFPKVFDSSSVYLIRAAEEGGFLEDALFRISNMLLKSYEIKKTIKNAMIYPVLVLLMMVGAFYFLLTSFVPKISKMFIAIDLELPQITKVLIYVSDFVVSYGLIIIIGVFGLFLLVIYLYKNVNEVRAFVDRGVYKIPVIKSVLISSTLVNFSLTMSSFLGGGIMVDRALSNIIESTSNTYVKDELRIVLNAIIDRGCTLSEGFDRTELFPKYFIQMLSIGEESGELSDTLTQLSDRLMFDLNSSIKTTVDMINPIIIVILGGFVLVLVLSLFVPLASMVEGV